MCDSMDTFFMNSVYKIYSVSETGAEYIINVIQPILVLMIFCILGILGMIVSTFGIPIYIFLISWYNLLLSIKSFFRRRRYERLRGENDELLHNLLEEKHLVSIIREYSDNEVEEGF